jgi:beta-glucosidase
MNKLFTRREFAKTIGAAGAASSVPLSLAVGQSPASKVLAFPANFLWGCATSAYQIEGAVAADGRGPTNWDIFSHTAGKTHQGETGDVAADSYHLYKEDVQLLKDLGAKSYRFSISWSRIFPQGRGKPNEPGARVLSTACR